MAVEGRYINTWIQYNTIDSEHLVISILVTFMAFICDCSRRIASVTSAAEALKNQRPWIRMSQARREMTFSCVPFASLPLPLLHSLLMMTYLQSPFLIHSFIQDISIAPLHSSKSTSNQRRSRHSTDTVSEFYAKAPQATATGNCNWRTCPRSLRGG